MKKWAWRADVKMRRVDLLVIRGNGMSSYFRVSFETMELLSGKVDTYIIFSSFVYGIN